MHIRSLPPLDALEAVLAAARAGSFSGAALRLNLDHSAISRRIALVEAWAGAPVFQRHGRGVRLTLEGERLAARIEAAVALLRDGPSVVGQAAELPVIRVGAVHSFARLWLIPNLARLEGTPPDLRIEPELDHALMSLSDARIAIRYGHGGWPGILAEPLFTETLTPVATPDLAAALGPDPDPQRLLTVPLLHDASTENWALWLASRGAALEARPMDRLFGGHDLTLIAAASGLGIALARLPYGADLIRRLALQPLSSHRIANPKAFHLVTRPGPRHPAVDLLMTRLRDLANNPSPFTF